MVLIRSLLSEILTWEYLSRGNRERNYGMRINITMPPHFTGAPIMLLLYGTVGHRKIQIPMRLIQTRPLHSIFNGPSASWRTSTEERRVGKECVNTGSSRGSPDAE